MDKIIRAKDYAQREGAKSVVERIARRSSQLVGRRMLDTPFIGGAPVGRPVYAEVGDGQWLALCECGGPEAVDPDEPIFYCFNCGNRATKGRPRPVIFPDNIEEIEQVLLERPMVDKGGTNDIDRMLSKLPAYMGFVGGEAVIIRRSWRPGESVEELRRQNGMIAELMKGKNLTPDPFPKGKGSEKDGE